MIGQAIAILQQAGFDPTAREMAEIIWLAVHIDVSEQSPVSEKERPLPDSPKTQAPENSESPITQPPERRAEVYLPSPGLRQTTATESREAIPIKVPAAVALRNSLALGRSLRPLMRKVPSRTESILDEEATVRRIAEEKIWMPVLKPAPQRWLELALVVEQSSSTAVWKQTITELQRLLEHHGAFRDVRTWGLRITQGKVQLFAQNSTGDYDSSPRSPKELIDPKGQRLVLLVSDCISPAWRRRFIHPVLKLWGTQGLMTILQLLPERLWERTALASEIPVQLHSLTPGVFNSQLIGETWDEDEIEDADFADVVQEDAERIHNLKSKNQNLISVPIVTLEPEHLLTWSRVVAGLGNVGTVGFKFSFPLVGVERSETQQSTEQGEPQLTAPALVSRFRATASPLARRLAGLMAAAPVSLSVVHLIQQTLLSQSGQIHVAEVFMSGLLKPSIHQNTDSDYIEYEFIEGIRELLLNSVPISEAKSVIEEVSKFVAERFGLSMRDFEARLLTPPSQDKDTLKTKIRPFAQIKAQVLRQWGGKYARLAEELEERWRQIDEGIANERDRQLLQSFEFEVVTVNARGKITNREQRQAQFYAENLGNNVTLEMVYIPGGTFVMGAPKTEQRSSDSERPQHQVTVEPFFMGKYPVTQAQWQAIASLSKVNRHLKPNPSYSKGADRPVERVSWYDAVEFCERLSRKTGRDYRLPSEAQWEYACRAGTTTPFHFGETITTQLAKNHGNYTYGNGPKGEYPRQTTTVGSFPANAFGLYDMHGNVWEWCADTWHKNYEGAPKDGSVWLDDNDNYNQWHLLRGGSWRDHPEECRCAYRKWNHANNVYHDFGFRVVCGVARTQ